MSANASAIAESSRAPSSTADTSCLRLPDDDDGMRNYSTVSVVGSKAHAGGSLFGTPNYRRVRGVDDEFRPQQAASDRSASGTSAARVGSVVAFRPSGVPYDADLRSMLVATERELAEAREEAARRGSELDALRESLSRDRSSLQSLQLRHDAQLQTLRSEFAEESARLHEQIAALTQVADGAMAEQSRLAEEAARRKAQLLALLDREREEKSQIMADYRQQTESLLAEQGREITSLRHDLRGLREAQEELLAARQAAEARAAEAALSAQRERAALSAQQEAARQQEAVAEALRGRVAALQAEAEQRAAAQDEGRRQVEAAHAVELRRADELLHALRADLARAVAQKAAAQQEAAAVTREAERVKALLAEATREAEEARERLRVEGRGREELLGELQSTVRVLSARLAAHDEDTQRLQEELTEADRKLHDAHTFIGRKDAAIGQLNARLRAYESKMGPIQ